MGKDIDTTEEELPPGIDRLYTQKSIEETLGAGTNDPPEILVERDLSFRRVADRADSLMVAMGGKSTPRLELNNQIQKLAILGFQRLADSEEPIERQQKIEQMLAVEARHLNSLFIDMVGFSSDQPLKVLGSEVLIALRVAYGHVLMDQSARLGLHRRITEFQRFLKNNGLWDDIYLEFP